MSPKRILQNLPRFVRWGLVLALAIGLTLFLRTFSSEHDKNEGTSSVSPGRSVPSVREDVSQSPNPVEGTPTRTAEVRPEVTLVPPDPARDEIEEPTLTTITIQCEDAAGATIAGCLVEARGAPGGEATTAVFSDGSGRALLHLPTSPAHVLRAEDPGKASSGERTVYDWELEEVDRNQEGILHMVLYPYLELRGRVRWGSGQGIAGVVVSARSAGVSFGKGAMTAVEPTTTNSDGIFALRIEGIPSRIVLEATCGTLHAEPQELRLPDAASKDLEIVFPDQSYGISGTVRCPAKSDPGTAFVVLAPQEPAASTRTEETDSRGSFSFHVKGPGEYRLAARSGAHLSTTPVTINITDANRSAVLDLFLSPASSIRGRIQDGGGEPLANVPVVGVPTSGPPEDAWLVEPCFAKIAANEIARTDERGEFELGEIHRDYVYDVICAPDEGRPECLVYERGVHPDSPHLVIVVDEARMRGAVLAGTAVRGAEREPVPEVSFIIQERYAGRSEWGGSREKILRTEDGVFVLEGLMIGNEYFIEAHIARCAPLNVGPWTATEEVERVDLAFGMDGELRATVQYSNGTPTRDWIVTIVGKGQGPRPGIRLKPLEEDGLVRVRPLAEGRYLLSAERDGTIVGPLEVEIHAGRVTESTLDVGPE